jgi:hypothetical protein
VRLLTSVSVWSDYGRRDFFQLIPCQAYFCTQNPRPEA